MTTALKRGWTGTSCRLPSPGPACSSFMLGSALQSAKESRVVRVCTSWSSHTSAFSGRSLAAVLERHPHHGLPSASLWSGSHLSLFFPGPPFKLFFLNTLSGIHNYYQQRLSLVCFLLPEPELLTRSGSGLQAFRMKPVTSELFRLHSKTLGF